MTPESPSRVLVTGGAGFIGSTLVDRLLAEGYQVDVVDDLSSGSLANLSEARSERTRRLRFHQLDVSSPQMVELMARCRPEVVFHLAAQPDVRVSVARPVEDARTNIEGSLQVLEGARSAGTRRVVYTASGGTLYGDTDPAKLPLTEAEPHRPLSPYGASKRAVLDYLHIYRELYGLEYCALALANIYGPRQDPHGEAGVVAIFAGQLVAGRQCVIYGDGSQTRDFVFVDDVVDALVRASRAGDGLVVNVGTGRETSVLQLYQTMAKLAGETTAPRFAPARAGELQRSSLDAARAATRLGWRAWTGLEEGLESVLEQAGRRKT
ncbi:MAG: SDR family NAD(P)-dependent oxidoreductase [Acidimicrobiales bacterium]|nr:SDR family NAD(P)-dependent oxidoreductase [Acidimicrobiales bacterium]MBO0886614.1 SDR family NAD(P)-dependent oxidoreductase [Acidimicrobiales bacterium]